VIREPHSHPVADPEVGGDRRKPPRRSSDRLLLQSRHGLSRPSTIGLFIFLAPGLQPQRLPMTLPAIVLAECCSDIARTCDCKVSRTGELFDPKGHANSSRHTRATMRYGVQAAFAT